MLDCLGGDENTVTGMLVGVYTLPPGVAAIVIDGIVLALLLPSVREYCG